MGSILDVYPEYRKTVRLDELRATEYGYLDEQDQVYLDYTGAGLAARTQYRAHEKRLRRSPFGNPHSINPTSKASTKLVELARARVLKHLNARMRFVLTFDNHNSVNGIREFARRRHARTVYVPAQAPELRVNTAALVSALSRRRRLFRPASSCRNGLFAFPAQSNFSGVRHPLSWVSLAQERGYDVLLDAAAYLPTGTLDLSTVKPEFVILSWYKLFGYPTGLGCLIARRDALERLARPWFSGGTIQDVNVGIQRHTMAPNESAFEDGTLNFLSIPDVHFGLDWLADIGMPLIETRVRCLTGWFLDRLKHLEHSDGRPMVRIYGPTSTKMRGGTVCFNFLDAKGKVIDERLVDIDAAMMRISLRTGCFCNPGGAEDAFGLDVAALRPLRRRRPSSMDEYVQLVGLPSAGAIRVSFGLASTAADVDRFIVFAEKTYQDRVTTTDGLPPRGHC
ncbi:uncharacterized protein N7477_007225 [Penicillium maclennaniae]|uniref:uncharacterized protein n=1 Tax=Penicillium maclennaniae TaxID=1343394 RepID=UPI0025408FCE|nr:uncharacterized protein N7477_007225 [Penicillium maclennaniae]KAJ5664777.1 hypothetical protein N7477_007225 [Penicillium maclennaniae]